MKKDLGVLEAVFPMPVLMIATYDENGTVDVMNAAWGQICDYKKIALFLDEGHKTSENILKTKAFTVALADQAHMVYLLCIFYCYTYISCRICIYYLIFCIKICYIF